jgi:Protein of unknown function (DUF726)
MACGGKRWNDEFCAAHNGKIAGFEQLEKKLDSLEDYPVLFERTVKNYKKIGTVSASIVGGAALIAPLAMSAAPAVGGAVGRQLFGLSGRAAVRRGLASLGLGSLQSGGWGIRGGIAVVTALGAATGGTYSGVIANAYFRDIEGFKIRILKPGVSPSVVIINGFLTEKKAVLDEQWKSVLNRKYPDNAWYCLDWESQRLSKLGRGLLRSGSPALLQKAVLNAARHAAGRVSRMLIPCGTAVTLLGLAANSWHVTLVRAAQTGVLMADIISRTPATPRFVLIGHSLGARVIYHILSSLSGRDPVRIQTVHLLGGAVGCKDGDGWNQASKAVHGKIFNYYSRNDPVLKYLYSSSKLFVGSSAAGRSPIQSDHPSIVNVNVSDTVHRHSGFRTKAGDILISGNDT